MRVCTPEEFLAASYAERRKLVLAQIDAEPELWNQLHWGHRTSCGTAYCFGGWALTLAGENFALDGDGPRALHPTDVVERASELLGLGGSDSDDRFIFAGYNSRVTLGRMVDALNDGESLRPAFLDNGDTLHDA